jgi:hypothetical protein
LRAQANDRPPLPVRGSRPAERQLYCNQIAASGPAFTDASDDEEYSQPEPEVSDFVPSIKTDTYTCVLLHDYRTR